MGIPFLNKSILATGWLVIISAILVTVTFNPARLSSFSTGLNTESKQLFKETTTLKNKGIKVLDNIQLNCMAKNIYYEAGQESLIGKLAVGQVVLNRLANATNSTICGIVNERSKDTAVCQFSWNCDSHLRPVDTSSKAWRDSIDATTTLLQLNTETRDLTNGATHYHNTTVHPPWANTLKRLVQIDGHIFYR